LPHLLPYFILKSKLFEFDCDKENAIKYYKTTNQENQSEGLFVRQEFLISKTCPFQNIPIDGFNRLRAFDFID
jgi:hypothetical protein